MAVISDLAFINEAERIKRLNEIVEALVRKAGGKVELGFTDFFSLRGREEVVITHLQGVRTVLELVDPNAPVDGGHYWILAHVGEGERWVPACYWRREWWIPGAPKPVKPLQIGARIPEPAMDNTDGTESTAA